MITETRYSRTHFLHSYERRLPRRRHHTLDNATLDQFNFICVPLNLDEKRPETSSSQSNLNRNHSVHLVNPNRRVRFNLDINDSKEIDPNRHTFSSEDLRSPKPTSIHRVEFQIPLEKDINPWLNVDCSPRSSTPARIRSLTSQKIDIHYPSHHGMSQQGVTSSIEPQPASHAPSTGDSDKAQSEWYKDMYSQMHKPPETKKDFILVKLPPTVSRYRDYYQQRGERQNPYTPTYTFPEEFNGNLQSMEDYIRRAATQHLDDETQYRPPSPVRASILHVKDHPTTSKRAGEKVTRFEDHYSLPKTSPPTDPIKSNNTISSSTITVRTHPTANPPSSSATDDEQKTVYKRILRGGDIPSSGLQKFVVHNRDFRWHVETTPHKKQGQRSEPTVEQTRQEDGNSRVLSPTNDKSPKNAQPIYKALALHNFYAQSHRELPFKKGDTFLVKRRINDDWLEGEHQGVTGIFPLNHVELFPVDIAEEVEDPTDQHHRGEEHEGEAIVKYDFIPQKTFELQLRKGDKVILLRRLDNNWYEGRLNHLEGIFPASYVDTLREPPEFIKPSEKSHVTERVQSPAVLKSVLKNSTRPQPAVEEKSNTNSESPTLMRKCQVLYDYTPQNPDELELHVGDIITIVEMCDDGWYCGLMEKSKYTNKMEFGTFPGNYVKLFSENE